MQERARQEIRRFEGSSGRWLATDTIRQQHWFDDEEMRWAIQHWATRIGVKAPQVRFQIN